jgi:hypothetical protein
MLKEYPCQQVKGDYARRFISDSYFDLYVWFRPDGEFYGFQLCYDKLERERALTWLSDRGFSHYAVDSGEDDPTRNCAPAMMVDGRMPVDAVRAEFLRRGRELDVKIQELVISRLDEYKSHQHA